MTPDEARRSLDVLCKDCRKHRPRSSRDCAILISFRNGSPITMANLDRLFKDGICVGYEARL